jgi:hypothetical protein
MPPASTELTNITPLKASIVRMLVFNLLTVFSPFKNGALAVDRPRFPDDG